MAPGRASSMTGPTAPANDAEPDPRFAALAAAAQAGERRALSAVARLAEDVARLGQALEARLARADGRVAAELRSVRSDLATLEQMMARRLAAAEAGQAEALAAMRAELAAAVEQLAAGVARAERGAAEAAADLGRRLEAMAAATEAREARQTAALEGALAEGRLRAERQIGQLRVELLRRDAALKAAVDAAVRPRPWPQRAASLVLALAGGAAALSLVGAGVQLLAGRGPPPRAGAVRLHLPLRPTLPLELEPGPPAAPPPPGAPPRAAPRQVRPPAAAAADYAGLAQAIARGDRAALDRARALAASGAPTAELLLAKLYEAGQAGLPKDLALARDWTARAAQGGERAAMHNLAVYMVNGQGGPQDPAGAARWFAKAAQAGVVDAQFNLALLYENGRGVPRNLIEAYRWYSVGANAGDGLARARAVALEAKLTPKERAAAAAAIAAFEPGQGAAPAPVSPPLVAPAATLADSQRLLAREGYFIGATDGTDSPTYRTAVATYLRDHPQAQRLVLAP